MTSASFDERSGVSLSRSWSVLERMRLAYAGGLNAMEAGREASGQERNCSTITEVAYDLQAGSYVEWVRNNASLAQRWFDQAAGILDPFLHDGMSLLDVGTGDGTTLSGVLERTDKALSIAATDVSWSRCKIAANQLGQASNVTIWSSDLFHIPLASKSVDIVFTSHSLEPNGGREEAALTELARVARRALVLIEPSFELASAPARKRMIDHGYVSGLPTVATQLNLEIKDYRLLDVSLNELNPSGCLVLVPAEADPVKSSSTSPRWTFRCPVSDTPLRASDGFFFSSEAGLAYPVLQGVPILRKEHAIVASQLVVP